MKTSLENRLSALVLLCTTIKNPASDNFVYVKNPYTAVAIYIPEGATQKTVLFFSFSHVTSTSLTIKGAELGLQLNS
jgi:hypothetical protein